MSSLVYQFDLRHGSSVGISLIDALAVTFAIEFSHHASIIDELEPVNISLGMHGPYRHCCGSSFFVVLDLGRIVNGYVITELVLPISSPQLLRTANY